MTAVYPTYAVHLDPTNRQPPTFFSAQLNSAFHQRAAARDTAAGDYTGPSPVPSTSKQVPAQGDSSSMKSSIRLPMAETLAKHRAEAVSQHPPGQTTTACRLPVPESLLLRDILYMLQGINGQYVRFKVDPTKPQGPRRPYRRGEIVVNDEAEKLARDREMQLEDGIEFILENTPYCITAPTRGLLHQLAELGWLYRKIGAKISLQEERRIERAGGMGRVEHSLHAALRQEMTKYSGLVADLESQLKGDSGAKENLESGLAGLADGLTLRRLVVRTESMRLRMRMMGMLAAEAGVDNVVGGALLTSLHQRTSNGDPFIRDFSSRLLTTLSVPFFATLSSWIYEGELDDPFSEFFVELNPELAKDSFGLGNQRLGEIEDLAFGGEEREGKIQSFQLWEESFRFRPEMLPGFLGEAFGRKIFSTGKSLNFMKYSCGDNAWVVEKSMLDGGNNRTLQYADMAGLESSISLAYSVASQRLFDIFFDKFRLLDHLKNLKDYMMLGKGDFVQKLMEDLGSSLAKPANMLYRHNLTAKLEEAVRGSTTNVEQEGILRCLDARMLEFTQGELGWDVFTLEYKVDAPLNTVLDPKSMENYSKMFKHLWQIKRVEHTLNVIWGRLMTGARTFLRVPELTFDLHQTRISLGRMIFFVRQLQYYCHLEVIGCSWQVLEDFALKKEGDLDSLIEAHRSYLHRLVTKALLISTRRSSKRAANDQQSPTTMLDDVRRIFRSLLSFQEAADSLCNYALAEADRQDKLKRDKTSTAPISSARNGAAINGIRERLAEYSNDFQDLAKGLVVSLGQAPDLDMRFLAVRLNHNYFFVNPNKQES